MTKFERDLLDAYLTFHMQWQDGDGEGMDIAMRNMSYIVGERMGRMPNLPSKCPTCHEDYWQTVGLERGKAVVRYECGHAHAAPIKKLT
jgi:hypothetical protein